MTLAINLRLRYACRPMRLFREECSVSWHPSRPDHASPCFRAAANKIHLADDISISRQMSHAISGSQCFLDCGCIVRFFRSIALTFDYANPSPFAVREEPFMVIVSRRWRMLLLRFDLGTMWKSLCGTWEQCSPAYREMRQAPLAPRRACHLALAKWLLIGKKKDKKNVSVVSGMHHYEPAQAGEAPHSVLLDCTHFTFEKMKLLRFVQHSLSYLWSWLLKQNNFEKVPLA